MTISNEWSLQKTFLRQTHNREVNEFFRDIEDPLPDNSTARKTAKRACLITPKDSQNMALMKMMTFYFVIHKAHLKPEIYGIPVDEFQQDITFRPIIQLFFKQDEEAVPEGYRALRGQITFRLVDETSKTITTTKLTEIAREIKNQFASGNGFLWNRGKLKRVYKDAENGVNLLILCSTESEGNDIIQRVYRILDKPFDPDKCTNSNPDKSSINNPGTQTILGQTAKKRRWRPTANIRFTHALAIVHGLSKAITLVDRTGTRYDALVD